MSILTLVLNAVVTIVPQMISIIVAVFTGLASVWVDTSGTNPELTLVGAFSLMAFVAGLSFFGLRFIGSLISLRTAN